MILFYFIFDSLNLHSRHEQQRVAASLFFVSAAHRHGENLQGLWLEDESVLASTYVNLDSMLTPVMGLLIDLLIGWLNASTENRLPGVIYGVDDDKNVLKVMVTVDTKEVKKQIRTLGRSFENTIHEISVPIEGKPEPLKFQVVPRTTQFCARKFSVFDAVHVYLCCNPLCFLIQ